MGLRVCERLLHACLRASSHVHRQGRLHFVCPGKATLSESLTDLGLAWYSLVRYVVAHQFAGR